MGEKVSQEVRAPFCILSDQSSGDRGSPWPLALLTVSGMFVLGVGVWTLVESPPDYGFPVVLMLAGGVPLLMAFWVVRRTRSDVACWLGCDYESFTFAQGDSINSWRWAEVNPFRVTETVTSFQTRHERPGQNEVVNFVRTTNITLFSNALDGTQIDIPFHVFMPDGGRELDRAENLCMFLNDILYRGQNGGLAQGAPSFLAPAELHVVPMTNGGPAATRRPESVAARPAIQRQR